MHQSTTSQHCRPTRLYLVFQNECDYYIGIYIVALLIRKNGMHWKCKCLWKSYPGKWQAMHDANACENCRAAIPWQQSPCSSTYMWFCIMKWPSLCNEMTQSLVLLVQSSCLPGKMACISWCKMPVKLLSGKIASNAKCKCLWKVHHDYTNVLGCQWPFYSRACEFNLDFNWQHGKSSLYCNIVALLCQYLNNLYKIHRISNKQSNIIQLKVARKPRKILGG